MFTPNSTTIRLRLGELEPNIFNRAQRAGSVINEIADIKDTISYIDLRWNKSIAIKLKNDQQKAIKEEEQDKTEK
ncbi:MAG: hypothetical protein MZU95_04200 [Desulfomicrobium escambiense]|nr:hypothetical protein [Desulfomicrobium escambiense]